MSLMFKQPAKERVITPELVETMLNENIILINIITEYQNKGDPEACLKYHHVLMRNLLYLASLSDFEADQQLKHSTTLLTLKQETGESER